MFFHNRGYYEPVLAEPHAAQTYVLFPASASSFPFAINPGRSLIWDISLGAELPIFAYGSSDTAPTGVKNGWGIGLWFPISFHMVEDLGKDPSNPILNTDYRFSGMVKAQKSISWIGSNSHIGTRFQFGHESTHIGDEFELGALKAHPNDFLRVNVSYEYYDWGGSFEPNFGEFGRYQLKLRGGDIWLWRPGNGWYSPQLLQPYGKYIALSNRNHEPYAQAELYVQPKQGPGKTKLGWILSADIRDRTIYQYTPAPDITHRNSPEPTEVSINMIAGARQVRTGQGFLGTITPTYFLRYYHGVNPNGQFRSQDKYQEYGFGVQFALW
jgi:hypothetical protein